MSAFVSMRMRSHRRCFNADVVIVVVFVKFPETFVATTQQQPNNTQWNKEKKRKKEGREKNCLIS